MNELDKVFTKVGSDLDLDDNTDRSSYDTLLSAIAMRVDQLMQTEPELLMSYLYRLDVSESKVQEVLSNSDNPINGLARLILDRQILRLQTKKAFRQDPIEGWEW